MIISDNKTLYAMFKNGTRVSTPNSFDVVQYERSKMPLEEQSTVQVLPVTQDGRVLLNE